MSVKVTNQGKSLAEEVALSIAIFSDGDIHIGRSGERLPSYTHEFLETPTVSAFTLTVTHAGVQRRLRITVEEVTT